MGNGKVKRTKKVKIFVFKDKKNWKITAKPGFNKDKELIIWEGENRPDEKVIEVIMKTLIYGLDFNNKDFIDIDVDFD